jgi:hypothetical protein
MYKQDHFTWTKQMNSLICDNFNLTGNCTWNKQKQLLERIYVRETHMLKTRIAYNFHFIHYIP